ncbi:hypothetical protein [Ursidibacter arcticus]
MAGTICSHCGQACGVIFRWARTEPKTGKVIRAKKRPFPIPLCACKS